MFEVSRGLGPFSKILNRRLALSNAKPNNHVAYEITPVGLRVAQRQPTYNSA